MRFTESQYRIAGVLANPHIQSALSSSAWRKRSGLARMQALNVAVSQHLLNLPDGIRLLGFHYLAPAARRKNALVLLLHGWEGSAQSSYINHSAAELLAEGFDVFALNFRDHGQTHDLNEGLFHSCRLQEIIDAAKQVAAHYRPKNYYVVYKDIKFICQ